MSHWPVVPLTEVLRYRKQFIEIDDLQTYKRCRVQLHAQGVVLRDKVPGSEIKTKKQQVCRAGDFLVAEIDAKLGGFGIVPLDLHEAIVSSHYFLYEVVEERMDGRFLDYFIRTRGFLDQVNAQGSTNYAAIRPQDVLQYAIPFPPMDEQRRLVARIDDLNAKIEEARRHRSSAISITAALWGTFLRRLFKEGESLGWKQNRLGDLVMHGCYGTSEKTHDDKTGTPILRMGNIQDGRLVTSDLKFLHLSTKDRADMVLKRGDILVNRTNSAELVGKSAVFDLDQDFGFASYIIRLRINQQEAMPRLVAHYINSPLGRNYMFAEKKQMTGQANVNMVTLRALPIALPSRSQQEEVLAYIDQFRNRIDGLGVFHEQTSRELDSFLPSLLNQAYQGQLP